MKAKLLPIAGGLVLCLAASVKALYTIEQPFNDVGTTYVVPAASHTWTRVLSSSSTGMSSGVRSGFTASIDSTVTIPVGLLVTRTTTTPTTGLGVHSEKIGASTDFIYFPYGNGLTIWAVAIGTFPVNVSISERGQR